MPKKKHDAQLRELTQPIYSRWRACYLSFYFPGVWVDVMRRWKGLGFLYLLLVVMLFSVPLAVRMMANFDYFLKTKVVQVIQLIPELDVQDGHISFTQPMPYQVRNKQHEVVGLVDTTDKTKAIDDRKYPHLSFLITKDTIYYRAPSYQFFSNQPVSHVFGPLYEQKIDPSLNEVFTGEDFVRFAHIDRLKMLSMLTIYPLLVAIFFIMLAGFFLMLAVVGKLIAKTIFKTPLSFSQSCRLIVVSATPALLLLFLTLTLDRHFVGSGTLFLGLIALYYCLGVIAYKRDTHQLAINTN